MQVTTDFEFLLGSSMSVQFTWMKSFKILLEIEVISGETHKK